MFVVGCIVVAAFIALTHTAIMVRRHGLVNAWRKSVARKGSWTASLAHFYAMAAKSVVEQSDAARDVKDRRVRDIWGRFVVRTKETHEDKAAVRRRWTLISKSRRFEFHAPSASRDAYVHSLYNDEATMLPHLPMLCPMSWEALVARRTAHRAAHARTRAGAPPESYFLDVLDRESGALVGTAGFRSLAGGVAEFGIVITRSWQRRGACTECFENNAALAAGALGCRAISASTLEANAPMRAFLARQGLRETGRRAEHGLEWLVHEAPLIG
jgi:RimJ/RimL family protein N-acetyltransferase